MEDVIGVGEAGQAFLPDAHGAASIQDPVEEASVLFRLVCFNKSKFPFFAFNDQQLSFHWIFPV